MHDIDNTIRMLHAYGLLDLLRRLAERESSGAIPLYLPESESEFVGFRRLEQMGLVETTDSDVRIQHSGQLRSAEIIYRTTDLGMMISSSEG